MARNNKRARAHHSNGAKPNSNSNLIAFDDFTPKRSRKKKVEILPRNVSQESYIFCIEDYTITFGVGPAGTGKTLIATLMAIQALKRGEVEKIVITRPAVSVDEQHGFLPGTLVDKMAPWTRPIFDVFEEYYTPQQIAYMIEDGLIEICPLAYMRGRTYHNAWIVADEMQNATPSQMKMVLTRIGQNSRMVVTGDLNQHDRGYEENGLRDFLERIEHADRESVAVVHFTKKDVERSTVVTEILNAYGGS